MTKSGEHKGIAYYVCVKCRVMGKNGINIHSDFLEKEVLKELTKHKQYEIESCGCELVLPTETCKKREKPKPEKPLINPSSVYEKYAEGIISKEEFVRQRELAQEQEEQEANICCDKTAGATKHSGKSVGRSYSSVHKQDCGA